MATQDTVIQLRAAIRKVLAAADRVNPQLAAAVRATLTCHDDYATLGKPPCDWDDPKAREALVDALVRDAQAALTPWRVTSWTGRWPPPQRVSRGGNPDSDPHTSMMRPQTRM